MIGMTIDASEIEAFAAKSAGAASLLGRKFERAGRQSGFAVMGRAQQLAPVDTGNMKNQIGPPEVSRIGASGVQVRVAASAQSEDGYPYPYVIEHGRGPIEAAPGKFLRFEIGGEVIFAKRVGPAAAQPFMAPALQQMRPNIVRFFQTAMSEAVAEMVV